MVVYRWKRECFDKLHPVFNWLLTFSFVNVAWVFFRADSIRDACRFLRCIGNCEFGKIRNEILACFKLPEYDVITKIFGGGLNHVMVIYFCVTLIIVLGFHNAYEQMNKFKPSLKTSVGIAFLFVWSVISLSEVSTFLYFNF